jgi:methionine-R-sulfoxide reductase
MHRKISIQTVTSIVCIVISSAVCGQESRGNEDSKSINWDETLTPEEYRILRQCGTEAPFTGEFWDHHEDGIYVCAGCKHPLFDSSTKFESGSGWPSFFDVVDNSFIDTKEDLKYGMRRIELLCHNCQGHLGHVFSDGPPPHGLRYCINSVSLDFTQRDSIAQ